MYLVLSFGHLTDKIIACIVELPSLKQILYLTFVLCFPLWSKHLLLNIFLRLVQIIAECNYLEMKCLSFNYFNNVLLPV